MGTKRILELRSKIGESNPSYQEDAKNVSGGQRLGRVKATWVVTILIVLVLGGLLAGCGSSEDRSQLEGELANCQKLIATQRSQLEQAQEEIATLKSQFEELQREVASLSKQVKLINEHENEGIQGKESGRQTVDVPTAEEQATSDSEESSNTPLKQFFDEMERLGIEPNANERVSAPRTGQTETGGAAQQTVEMPRYEIARKEVRDRPAYCKVILDIVVSGKVTRTGLEELLEHLYAQAKQERCTYKGGPTGIFITAYSSWEKAKEGQNRTCWIAWLSWVEGDTAPEVSVSDWPEDWFPYEIDWGK